MQLPGNHALKRSAAMASLWSVIQVAWAGVASFLVFAVLIRSLTLAEIGIFALASSFVEIVRVVAGAGLDDALQREEHVDDELLDTAFWGGLGIGLAAAIAMALAANLYARVMGSVEMVPLIYAFAALTVIASLSRVHWALRLRAFGHKLLTIQTIIATIIGGIGAILAAWNGAGVWALLIQSIATEVVGMALAWSSTSWRPGFRFSLPRFKYLLGFGSGAVLTRLLWTALSRVPDLFIGRMIGVEAVGIYRVAWRIVDLIGQVFLAPLARVAMIVLAKLQKEPVAFENAYCRILGTGSILMIPMVAGFGAIAAELIPLLFGDHVEGSILIAQILAATSPVLVANYFISSALFADGQPYVMVKIAAVQLVTTVVISALAAPFGLVAIAIAYVLRGYLTLPYQQYMLHRSTGISYARVLKVVGVPTVAAAAMVMAVLVLRATLIQAPLGDFSRVAIMIAFGAAVYAAMLALLDRARVLDQMRFARSLFLKVDPVSLR